MIVGTAEDHLIRAVGAKRDNRMAKGCYKGSPDHAKWRELELICGPKQRKERASIENRVQSAWLCCTSQLRAQMFYRPK
jgi:hypothetical protein